MDRIHNAIISVLGVTTFNVAQKSMKNKVGKLINYKY